MPAWKQQTAPEMVNLGCKSAPGKTFTAFRVYLTPELKLWGAANERMLVSKVSEFRVVEDFQ